MKLSITKQFALSVCFWACLAAAKSQQYNLRQLLDEKKLVTTHRQPNPVQDDTQKQAISLQGLVWLKGVSFGEGTIDVDLRGKDVFLQSFLGIAFHGVDSITYDAVYFRPFNFRHADTLRRKWSVQYFSVPEYDYDRLRKEHPLVYENAVTPVPQPGDWFHATIVVKNGWVTVYANHSATASLKVKLLNSRSTGMIGLWDDGLSGDFANLTLSR